MKKLLLLLTLLPVFLQAQESSETLDRITKKLAAWQQDFPADKIYLQTDKEIYAPGEIIWFSGMILNRSTHQFSVYYADLVVSVHDAAGNVIAGDKFPVTGGRINGDLLLPENLKLGNYSLAAFTIYQEEPENLFIKPLVVDRFYTSDARISMVYPDRIYTAGTKADIEMKVLDLSGSPADKFNLNYELRLSDQKLEEGKVRSVAGKAIVQTLLPAQTGKDPLELIIMHPKNLWARKFFLKTTADELSVKFYPEGGSLLGTVPQKTGLYASVWKGSPVDVEGDITSASGEVVSRVKTFHAGFGLFPLQVKPGVKYRFVVTSDYGKGQSFDIPAVKEGNAAALVITKTDPENLTADILVNSNQTQKLAVMVTRGYQLLWAAQMEISGNSRIKIPVSELGSGIAQLTLFNDREEVLSTRLAYLPESSQATLQISDVVAGDGKLKLTLTVRDENGKPAPAGLMVSIADTMRKLPAPASLKGQYFLNGDLLYPVDATTFSPDEAARKSTVFDYVMMCNELKGYSWEKVLTRKEMKAGETSLVQTGLSGRVTDKKGNPVPMAQVKVMDNRDMKLYTTQADGEGYFRYQEYQPLNMADLTLSASDKGGKGNYPVQTDPTVVEKVSSRIRFLNLFTKDPSLAGAALTGYLKSNPGLIFEQPSGKLQTEAGSKPRYEPYKSLLSTSTNLLDVIKSMKPFSLMNGQIVFGGMINSINFQSGALIVIDGVKMGTAVDVLNNIAPYDVDEIKISTDPMDIQKYTGLNNVGVIEITTKRGEMVVPSAVSPVKKEQLYKDGLRIPRNFLTSDALKGQSGKDLRTTLYWNPDLEIGASGTTTFSVPLSEIRSGFVISAEGMTASGKIIRAVKVFSVP